MEDLTPAEHMEKIKEYVANLQALAKDLEELVKDL